MPKATRSTVVTIGAVVAGLGVVAAAVAGAISGRGAFRRPDLDGRELTGPAMAAHEGGPQRALDAYQNLPLTFVENRGQTDPVVRYSAQGSGYAFHLTPEEIALSFVKPSDGTELVPSDAMGGSPTEGVALALRFLGSNPRVAPEGHGRAPGMINYIRGNDPARWRTGLTGYTRIVYPDLWPGVDLSLRGRAGELKYEFRVQPGARPADVRLTYAGADGLAVDVEGALLIETALGVLRDSPPVAYQEIGGARVPVESRYVLENESEYGFSVGPSYRPDHELIIDPGLDYSTFLGGANHELGASIAADAAGSAYVVGTTFSADFPTTAGAIDRSLASSNDVFISKLNPSGSALVYSTYLGGNPAQVPAGGRDPFEFGRGIAVDPSGNAYVTGQTTSGDFPTTAGAFDRSLNVGTFDATDAFVAKLDPTGSRLVYSTFLGGTDLDDALDIGIDGAGSAYVTGQIASRNFPTTPGAFDTTANGGFDAFVTKVNASGSGLVYSTYLGGADNELGSRVAVDAAGNAHVGGSTRSAGFPSTPGAFDPSHNGGSFETLFDAFVTKLNPAGSALVYSTFLGGSDIDFGDGLAIDAAGSAYVAGGTLSPGFPTTPGAFDTTFDGDSEGFVTKLNASGSGLVYSTFLRGAGASAVAVDADRNAWVAGGTSSAGAFTTPDAFDRQLNGVSDAYVAELNATGSALTFATFLGGRNAESGSDVALDPTGSVYVTGHTFSDDFPRTAGAFDTTFGGNPDIFWGDAFVTRFALGDDVPDGSSCRRVGARLEIHVASGGNVSLSRSGADLRATGAGISDPSCGSATVNNVDTIIVTGAAGDERFTVDLSGGQLAPGATAEGSGQSEIELDIDLGPGGDELRILGGSQNDRITLGSSGVKLNSDADSDITRSGLETLAVEGAGGADVISAGGGTGAGTVLTSPVRITGGTGNDRLTGGSAADSVGGGDGNDTIIGAAGADALDGGAGADTLSYEGSPAGVGVNLGSSPQSASGGHASGDVIAGFEHILGSSLADSITGSGLANVLRGLLGNDVLTGGAGNDNLLGAGGTDRFDGGPGTDDCDNASGEAAVSCES